MQASFTGDCLLAAARGKVYACNSDELLGYGRGGKLIWRVRKADGVVALAQRADGSLLLAGTRTLTAISPAGHHLWTVGGGIPLRPVSSDLIVDARGTAYMSTSAGTVRVIDRAGHVLAVLPAGGRPGPVVPYLALGPDGRLVVDGTDGVLRIFG